MADSSSDECKCDLRVILVGKSGNGKSATGNTILGARAFSSKRSLSSVTQDCRTDSGYRQDIQCTVTVVDTPGLFDTDQPFAKRALQIQNALEICPNPHAFLIVLNPEIRFTQEESLTVDMLRVIYGEVFLDHAILVFTRGAEFESDEDLDTDIRDNIAIASLMKECKNRVVRIENNPRMDSVIRDSLTRRLFDAIEKIADGGKRHYQYKSIHVHQHCLEEHLKNVKPGAKLGEELQLLVNTLSKELENQAGSRWRMYLLAGLTWAAGASLLGGIALIAGTEMLAGSATAATPSLLSGSALATGSNILADISMGTLTLATNAVTAGSAVAARIKGAFDIAKTAKMVSSTMSAVMPSDTLIKSTSSERKEEVDNEMEGIEVASEADITTEEELEVKVEESDTWLLVDADEEDASSGDEKVPTGAMTESISKDQTTNTGETGLGATVDTTSKELRTTVEDTEPGEISDATNKELSVDTGITGLERKANDTTNELKRHADETVLG